MMTKCRISSRSRRQHQTKAVNDRLGHEVMSQIPTDFLVQSLWHDVINPKVHAARMSLSAVSRVFAAAFLSGKIASHRLLFARAYLL